MAEYVIHDPSEDGIDRRGFLKCMACAGTGALCVMQGGAGQRIFHSEEGATP